MTFDAIARVTPFVGVTGPSGRFVFATDDRDIARGAFASRGFDEQKMAEALDIVRAEGFDVRGSTILDIGANVGVTTVPALTRFGFGASVALEPEPQNFTLLLANVALNGLSDHVRALNIAATDAPGSLTLELSGANHGDHRIRQSVTPGELGEQHRRTVEIAADRLDAVDLSGLPSVGLIWCDTQGHEGHVFEGLGDSLMEVPAVLEFWPYGLRRAGGLEALCRVIETRYTRVFDLERSAWFAADQVSAIASTYTGTDFTDLVAIP